MLLLELLLEEKLGTAGLRMRSLVLLLRDMLTLPEL
jgi:hypothetical protein